MAAPIKVGVLGSTGRTGESVVEGLLASETKFVRAPYLLFTCLPIKSPTYLPRY